MKTFPALLFAMLALGLAVAAEAFGQDQAPVITVQPTNRVTSIGGAATFSVTAIGTAPLVYRWRKDGVLLPAGTNRLLSLIFVSSNSAGTYTVMITNSFGSVTSQPASLTLTGAPPRIFQQPTNTLVCPGGPDSILRVQASGSPPFRYQWRQNGVAIPASDTNTLRLVGNPSIVGNYTVVVENDYGSETSHAAELALGPIIIGQPMNQTVLASSNTLLRVDAITCTGTHFQWRFNGANLPGATNDALVFMSPQFDDAGDYDVIVSDSFRSLTSSVARLTVLGIAPQIFEQPRDFIETFSTNILFAVTYSGAPTPVFQWYRNGEAIAGETNRTLRFMAFPWLQGDYWVVLSNSLGRVTSRVARFSVPEASPSVYEFPTDRSFCPELGYDPPARLFMDARSLGAAPTYFQWFKDGVLLEGQTNGALPLGEISSPFGDYAVEYWNFTDITNRWLVSVSYGIAFSAEPEDLLLREGESANFYSEVHACAPFVLQWYKNGLPVPGQTNDSLTFPTIGLADTGDYTLVASYETFSATSRVARLDIEQFDPVIFDGDPADQTVNAGDGVYLDFGYDIGFPRADIQWHFNGRPIPGETNDFLEFLALSPAQQGRYSVTLSNVNTVVTSRQARVLIYFSAPFFDFEPEDIEAEANGGHIGFYAPAFGAPPPSYQWLFNNRPLRFETNEYLSFDFRRLDQAGGYSLVASNFLGAVTSRVATLTALLAAPEFLSEPQDQTVDAGQTINLNGWASGSPVPTYQWLFNGEQIPGARDSSLYIWAGFSNQIGGYALVASNSVGMATSRVAQVDIVLRPPEFVVHPGPQQLVVGEIFNLEIVLSNRVPAHIQWQRNGENLPGATDYALRTRTTSTNDSGDYRAVVINDVGAATSFVARVDVRLPGPLDRWSWRRSMPQGNHLYAAAYGNGRHIAVGEAGAVLISTNGTDWKDFHKPGLRLRLRLLCFGNGRFVAHDSDFGQFVSSTNGVDWTDEGTRVPAGSQYFQSLSFGNGRFVATDQESQTHVSTNGMDWEVRKLDDVFFDAGATEPQSWVLHEAVFAHDRFIASFRIYSPRELSGILTSTNGLDWQSYFLPNPDQEILPSVASAAFGNNRYIGVLTYDPYRVLISTNGREWAIETLPIPPEFSWFSSVAFGTGRFVRSQFGNPLASSVDGLNWTEHPGVYSNTFAQVYFHGDRFVAVGDYGALATSTNGTDWQIHNPGSHLNLRGITRANGTFVVVGNDGLILSSTDGRDWTRGDSGTNFNFRAVTHFKGRYIAVGEQFISFPASPTDRVTIYTSTDAIHWQPVTDPSPASRGDFYSLAHSPEIIVAVGNTGTVSWSADGLTWESASPLPRIRDLNAVIWAAGAFHAAGKDGTVMTSIDGSQWRSSGPGGGRNLHGIAHGNGVFVTVGNRGRYYVGFPDASWQQGDWPTFADLSDIVFAGGRFVAVGDNGVLFTSMNGTNWTRQVSPSGNDLRSVLYADGSYWLVGNNESILQSDQVDPALRIRRVAGSHEVALELLGETGVSHRLQGSQTLADWTDVLHFIPDSGASEHRVVAPNTGGWRFYRLIR